MGGKETQVEGQPDPPHRTICTEHFCRCPFLEQAFAQNPRGGFLLFPAPSLPPCPALQPAGIPEEDILLPVTVPQSQ